ncbi:MAG: DUF302 domain-containing protein [Armatimonadia bacterium]|nr:DUF302 domain-containing protein [Armatimonadia bacterium]
MLYKRKAKGSIDEVSARLESAAADNQFGVLGVHNLKDKLAAKDIELGCECRIFEVCNPGQAKKVLDRDMSIANALPCRIAVYEEDGAIQVTMLQPTELLGLFGQPELRPVAQDVEAAMERIIETACG